MGDFNAKVEQGKRDNVVGSYGLGHPTEQIPGLNYPSEDSIHQKPLKVINKRF